MTLLPVWIVLLTFILEMVSGQTAAESKCPAGRDDYSQFVFCSASSCSASFTQTWCCMMTYVKENTTNFETCLCHPDSSRCIKESREEASQRSLCDVPIGWYILNSQPLSTGEKCQFGSVASITINKQGSTTCNAVLTRVKVNGVKKITFLTSKLCKKMVDLLKDDATSGLELKIGDVSLPVTDPLTAIDGPGGSAFLDIPNSEMNILNGLTDCQVPACAYNINVMERYVDKSDCKMVSYGSNNEETLSHDGVRQISLEETPGGCQDLPELFGAEGTLCYRNKDGKDVSCVGDSGAPIYCKSTLTPEYILMGVAAHQTQCGGSPEIRVIPAPI